MSVVNTSRPIDMGNFKMRAWVDKLTKRELEDIKKEAIVERGGPEGMVGPMDYYGTMIANKNFVLKKMGRRNIQIHQLKTSSVTFPKLTAKQKSKLLNRADARYSTLECEKCKYVEPKNVPKSDSGKTDNVFGDSGRMVVPLSPFPVPVIDAMANADLLAAFGVKLVDFDSPVPVSQKYAGKVHLFSYSMGRKYIHRLHGEHKGAFLEKHIFPQMMIPLSPKCGGYMMIGVKEKGLFHITSFKIPYGKICAISPNTYHGDSYLVGLHAISLTTDFDSEARVMLFRDSKFQTAPVSFVLPISRCATVTPYVIDLVNAVPEACDPNL